MMRSRRSPLPVLCPPGAVRFPLIRGHCDDCSRLLFAFVFCGAAAAMLFIALDYHGAMLSESVWELVGAPLTVARGVTECTFVTCVALPVACPASNKGLPRLKSVQHAIARCKEGRYWGVSREHQPCLCRMLPATRDLYYLFASYHPQESVDAGLCSWRWHWHLRSGSSIKQLHSG